MFEIAPQLLEPDPRISVAGWALVVVLVGYLALVEPWLGRATYRRLAADRGAFARTYRLWISILWLWVLGTGLVVALSPGLTPAHVGLARPGGPAVWWATGFAAYLCLIVLVTGIALRRRALRGGVPRQDTFSALLPGTETQRGYALALAISAGVCEEIFCRGLLIAAGIAAGLDPWVSAAVAVLLFGLAHLYQGVAGIVSTTVIGAALAALYLATGSLLLPIVVHIVIDLRSLLMVPAPATTVGGPQRM